MEEHKVILQCAQCKAGTLTDVIICVALCAPLPPKAACALECAEGLINYRRGPRLIWGPRFVGKPTKSVLGWDPKSIRDPVYK